MLARVDRASAETGFEIAIRDFGHVEIGMSQEKIARGGA
jgi:hypothetical protein